MWSGTSNIGEADATFSRNQTGTPDRYTFFTVGGELMPAPGWSTWLGVNVSNLIGVEGAFHYGRPEGRVRTTADVEGTANSVITTKWISQSNAEGSVLFYGNGLRFDQKKTVPFLIVGAGYLRQVDSDQAVIETGRTSEGLPPVGFSASAKGKFLMDSCWLDGGCLTRIQCPWE